MRNEVEGFQVKQKHSLETGHRGSSEDGNF